MPEKAPSLLDAINAAIPSGEEAETPETEEVETPEGEEVETPEGEEAETPEGEEDETPEGEEEAEGDEGEEEAEGEETPAKPPAKAPDPINDPLPKGTLQSTSERFKHVVDKLKEQTARAETIETQHNQLIQHITGAGMGAQEFGMLLDYASGVNSGTYEGLVKSRSILLRELEAVSKQLGEPMPGEDILANHPDLLKEVNDKLITPQRAMEIASQRNRTAAQTRLGQQGQQRQQTTQQIQQAQADGTAALTALGKELAGKDGPIEYKRKAQLVVDMLQDVMPNIPPKQWVQTFRAAYAKVPAARAAPAAGKPGAKPQPMRGNKAPAAAGSMAKQPKNLREAIDRAFEG
jgi:hypothetical protein